MTKPSNLESIEKGTGKSWSEWLALLDGMNAGTLSHREIADALIARTGIDGWWAQNVTVAYEQHIGRRVPGQVADGSFEVASSRTIDGSKEDVMALFTETYGNTSELNGVAVESTRSSSTDKRTYWKAELADGTRTIVACEERPGGKALIVATQVKIADQEAAATWRQFWKDRLTGL